MHHVVMLTPEASGDFCAFALKGEVSDPRVKTRESWWQLWGQFCAHPAGALNGVAITWVMKYELL